MRVYAWLRQPQHVLPCVLLLPLLQTLLLGGGWVSLVCWLLSRALTVGLVPLLPPIHWPEASVVTFILTALFSKGCTWLGVAAFVNSPNPVAPMSWWWWCILMVLHVGVVLIKVSEPPDADDDEPGSSSRADAEGEASYEGFGGADLAYTKYVMGFGAVAVPAGCEVVEVREVLQARDYYQVRRFLGGWGGEGGGGGYLGV